MPVRNATHEEPMPAPADGNQLRQEIDAVAGTHPLADGPADGAIGRTMFDQPGSEDMSITVLLAQERVQVAPSQSLVRIVCRGKERCYLGVVSAGPFAEPDSLQAGSPILLAVATRGAEYLPRYHGRLQVTLLGKELADGALVPPRLRPLPHSPVYLLDDAQTRQVLKADGDIRLGLVAGHDNVPIGIPSDQKAVLPRHTAILGTTGGGKSTTVARLVQQAQAANMAVILLDVEGEYVHLNEPTSDPRMRALLAERGLKPAGLPVNRMSLYHLVGRDTANPRHPDLRPFSIQFARLSPHAVMELLALTDAQKDRFLFAYDLAKPILREVGIFPQKSATPEEKARQEKHLVRLDELERGYPRLTLSLFLDIVGHCKALTNKTSFTPFNAVLKTPEGEQAFKKYLNPRDLPGNVSSWGKLLSLLWRLNRLKVFDRLKAAGPIKYAELVRAGQVSVVDLSDTGMAELTNLAIADLLRGIQEAQEAAYGAHEKAGVAGQGTAGPARVLLILEEAHEFLAEERVDKMPILFQQVARLAKRGRKRWIGLTFVTQLPQQLPRQVLAMVNNYILHKIMDAQVIATLRKTISNVDDGQWNRLPGLAPGQALVSFAHAARPLLVSMDPATAKLRLID